MEQVKELSGLQAIGDKTQKKTGRAVEVQGLVGWVLDRLRGLRGDGHGCQRQMRLIETLSLGGKKQLMMVSCAGEHFLVGGGMDSVETIVRLQAVNAVDSDMTRIDEPCR
jgi:flagellar biogenesis protein FliO